MKPKSLMCITAVALSAALLVPVQPAARDRSDGEHWHHHYKLIDIGAFGGVTSTMQWH